MSYQNFPSNQTTGTTPNPLAPAVQKPAQPLARVQHKTFDTNVIGDGFRRVGTDIVTQQLPGFFNRLLHSIADVLIPNTSGMPYINKSLFSGYSGYPGYTGYPVVPSAGVRMAQMPQYGQRLPPGFAAQPPVAELLPQRRAFDTFILPNEQTAVEVFQQLMTDAMTAGALTVSQVYDRLGAQNVSYMGVQYYWTPDDFEHAMIVKMPNGECSVKMPKAHLSANI